jgi:hypothetical protein
VINEASLPLPSENPAVSTASTSMLERLPTWIVRLVTVDRPAIVRKTELPAPLLSTTLLSCTHASRLRI